MTDHAAQKTNEPVLPVDKDTLHQWVRRKGRLILERTPEAPIWSWVNHPPSEAGQPGRTSRPWSVREILINELIGEEVRRLRLAANMTATELSQRLCCSQPHVTYLEHGTRPLWTSMLWDLAEIFDVPPDHFIRVAEAVINSMSPASWIKLITE